jgi:hypothetical protein
VVDQVYQPIVSDDDDQSETPSPRTELQIENPAEFRRKPDDEGDHLTVEEATAQRSRRPDPESAESAYERPITVHKVKGDGPISVNEAADAMRWARGYKLGGDLRAVGLSEAQISAMAEDAIARGERLDPLMPPPAEAKVLRHFGEDEDKPLSVTEAADQLTDWRARHQEAQQAELAELAGEAVQALQAEAQQAQPQPEPQRQPQPQPTPEQTERQLVAAERQWITHLKRMEGHEAAARNDYDQLVAAVVQEFPSLRNGPPNPADVEDLRVRDPARHAQLMQADQMLRERQLRIRFIAQQRGVHEQRQAQINSQARARARAKQDEQFEHLAEQHIPNWSSVHGEVRQQAVKTLEAAGLSKDEIRHLWSGDDSIDAHSSVLQLILAKAALYDRGHARAREIRQANLPQVIKPGTYRASGGDATSVAELQARLSRASGREALRLGAALTRAKRAMNGG